jgi:hypothetical protein
MGKMQQYLFIKILTPEAWPLIFFTQDLPVNITFAHPFHTECSGRKAFYEINLGFSTNYFFKQLQQSPEQDS